MKKHIGAILLLCIIAGIFFHSLFYPQVKIFSFPDYGQSDLWQQTYPAKYFLAESLKRGELPLWNPYVGGGYPEFAKAEIGALYLPNMIFLYIFSFPLAINMLYVSTFLIASVSMYFLCIRWKLHSRASLVSAVIFAYSTFFLTKFPHLSRIESASLLPLIMIFFDRLLEKPTLKRSALCAAVIAQQIYAGHFQMMFISGLILGAYMLYHFWKNRALKIFLYVGCMGLFVCLLSAIQLFPSAEFIQLTQRGAGFSPQQSLLYSFPWKNLATLFNPFVFGSPHNGTYPLQNFFDGNIFWENTLYISIPGILLVAVGIMTMKTKRKDMKIFLTFLGLVGLCMMAGKYSPFYFIHSIKPFSFFRAPSKYIFIVVFSISVLAGYGYQYFNETMQKRKINRSVQNIFFFICVSCIVFQLYAFHSHYMIIDKPENLLTDRADFPKSDQYRYVSYGSAPVWNKILIKNGWKDMGPYNALQKALVPNSNVLYGRYSFDVYRILLTRRTQTSIALSDKLYASATQSEQHKRVFNNFMDMHSVKTLITTNERVSYENRLSAAPRFHFADTTYSIKTVQNMIDILAQEEFSATRSAFVEKDLPHFSVGAKVLSIDQSAQKLDLRVDVPSNSLFVMTDTYYPGWNAYVDDKKTDIFPVNIDQRGIMVSQGAQKIRFQYEPTVFLYGKYITMFGYILISLLIARSLYQEYHEVSVSKN